MPSEIMLDSIVGKFQVLWLRMGKLRSLMFYVFLLHFVRCPVWRCMRRKRGFFFLYLSFPLLFAFLSLTFIIICSYKLICVDTCTALFTLFFFLSLFYFYAVIFRLLVWSFICLYWRRRKQEEAVLLDPLSRFFSLDDLDEDIQNQMTTSSDFPSIAFSIAPSVLNSSLDPIKRVKACIVLGSSLFLSSFPSSPRLSCLSHQSSSSNSGAMQYFHRAIQMAREEDCGSALTGVFEHLSFLAETTKDVSCRIIFIVYELEIYFYLFLSSSISSFFFFFPTLCVSSILSLFFVTN